MTLSIETQHSLTSGNSIDRWGGGGGGGGGGGWGGGCAANTEISVARGAKLKTSKKKGLVLPQRFVHHSNKNNLDERKAVWTGLDRTLTEAGPNDDLITELEFTEALSGLSKDAAPDPDKVKFSDIKNLSRASNSDCIKKTSQQDRFLRTGLIVTPSQSQTGKGPYQAERIPYRHHAEHHGKAD